MNEEWIDCRDCEGNGELRDGEFCTNCEGNGGWYAEETRDKVNEEQAQQDREDKNEDLDRGML